MSAKYSLYQSLIFYDMPSIKKDQWPKPSMEMGELLDRHISRFVAERRKMFGFPCYFVNGNMFAGTFSNMLFARFSVEDRERLNREGLGELFEPVKGRIMTEYRTFSKKVLDDPEALDNWLDRSYAYVSSLEAKLKG
jgi:TfoX/Sxy family transcriptional regulator of competence genes